MKISRDPQDDEQQENLYQVPPTPQRKAYDAENDDEFLSVHEAIKAEPPKKAAPVKKKAKPKKAPPKKAAPVEEYEEDEYEEDEPRRFHFPFGLLIVLIMIGLVVWGGFQVSKFYADIDGGVELGDEQTFSVEQGTSIASIATQLKGDGLIQYDWLFKEYTKYSGKAEGIQYGDFQLRAGMSYNDIIKTLSVQQVHRQTTMVTFPEGSTCFQIAAKMEENGLCTAAEFLACANGDDGSDFSQYAFWTQIPENADRAMKCEGYLFPDTYEFYVDDEVYNYVDTFYGEFDSRTADLMDTIAAKGTTINDVVILASFIQEEAGLEAEDYKVSAVFHNRLESDDPLWAEHKLESNASSYIQNDADNNYVWNSLAPYYGSWDAIPENIRTAYDTYAISGLPAGAISNPGYASINAALNPDEDFMAQGYFFFVTGAPDTDVAGQYLYAKNADEHYQNCVVAGWA